MGQRRHREPRRDDRRIVLYVNLLAAVGSLAMYFAVALSTAPGRASLQMRRRAARSVPTR